jgi:valyl-tRNA synthetase
LGNGREAALRDWLTHIKDWNISRQIVWGIRIPVWYEAKKNLTMDVAFLDGEKKLIKGTVGELLGKYSLAEIEAGLQTLRPEVDAEYVVARNKPGEGYLQETDTFDTWFSSGQWPVVTLKTNQPGDFEYFYPTTVMETGYDILTRWVMRMMLLGTYLTGHSPFKWVYLHGMVRDEKGRKMSKSIGNVVNPMELVGKYGADALRMALVLSTTPGNDSAVGDEKVRGMRNFSNKIWNAARYVQMHIEQYPLEKSTKASEDEDFDKKLQGVIKEVTENLDKLRVGQAAETAHNEFWHWYCDMAIEKAKEGKVSSKELVGGLITFLKLLHPFMPFVTEAVWGELKAVRGNPEEVLTSSTWPR